jgi:hypothetical protein
VKGACQEFYAVVDIFLQEAGFGKVEGKHELQTLPILNFIFVIRFPFPFEYKIVHRVVSLRNEKQYIWTIV